MPVASKRTVQAVADRKYPKGKVSKGIGAKSGTVKVKKPKITGGPKSGPAQKPVRTPMKKAHRVARSNKAKSMARKGVKGPVQYKKSGGHFLGGRGNQ